MESPILFSAGLKSFIALSVVLAMAAAILYGWRRIYGKDAGCFSQRHMRTLASCYLGPKKSICMVKIPDAILVLGISGDRISLLSKIKDQDQIDAICAVEDAKHIPFFNRHLSAISKKKKSEN